jgi:quinol monooxygenase YgiN
MSVIVIARLSKSSEEIERAGQQDPDLWRNVSESARESGCTDRKLIATDEETLLVEEWDDTGVFEAFFDRTPSYRQAMDEAGFQGFPDDIKLWHRVPGGDFM